MNHPKDFILKCYSNIKSGLKRATSKPCDTSKFEAEFINNKSSDCKYCFNLYGAYGIKDIYNASWFNGFKEIAFEDLTIKIPIGYQELLTQIYGDYMTPPPIEMQIPRHSSFYVNLKERLTLTEIKKRVKTGEKVVY